MRQSHGFTLIELMTVVAIVGIIAAIAIPSFNEQMAKSRRSDAFRGLGDLALKQEKYRSSHSTYGTCDQALAPGTCTTFNSSTASPYYTFAVTVNTATAFTLTATPKAGTAQAGDRCGTLTYAVDNAVRPGQPPLKTAGASSCF